MSWPAAPARRRSRRANACTRRSFFHDARTMSAKHSKKGVPKPTPPAAPSSPAPESAPALADASAGAAAAATPADTAVSWLDSTDPKKRLWGKIIFCGIWLYVGALWLLALDQTFNWGIFGPKVPPVP